MIGQYTVFEWLLFFYTYSFLGWVFESCYVSIRKKRWVNRGFLKGPFLPIYGGGAVMMLFVSYPFKENLILTFFAGAVGATLLELVTGMLLEAIFKVRYWDYSNQKFNYKGHICLSSTIAWGFFTIGMNEVLHPGIIGILALLPERPVRIVMGLVTCFLLTDITISVREALDLRNLLVGMEDMRKEMLLMRRRVDVIIACMDDSFREFVEAHPGLEHMEEIYKSVEKRYVKIRQSLPSFDKMPNNQKQELRELKEKFSQLKEKHLRLQKKGGSSLKSRILGNPSMVSKHYKLSLETLKEWIKEEQTKEKHLQDENQ
ncbi:MAG: hypothetical protein SPI87_11550 [Anaerobutyricum sp.]|nr:hypothetical protein [Eubacterium sp.]MDY6047627.1 hypothetical protein [Anaerobutyricum sp.]